MTADLVDRTLRLFGTDEQVADLLGIHPTAVSHWRRRHRVIPPLRIVQLQAEAERRGLGERFDADGLRALVEARELRRTWQR